MTRRNQAYEIAIGLERDPRFKRFCGVVKLAFELTPYFKLAAWLLFF